MLPNNKFFTVYKILLVGDTESGKSALCTREENNNFLTAYEPTVGLGFGIVRHLTTQFTIFASSGQQRFARIRYSYYQNSRAVGVCMDLSDTFFAKKQESQSDQDYIRAYLQKWLGEIKKRAPNTPIQIIGTKTDAINEQVFETRIESFRTACNTFMNENKQIHACHITSAKRPINEKLNQQLGSEANKDQPLTSCLSGVFLQVIAHANPVDPLKAFKAASISRGGLDEVLKTYQTKRNKRWSFFCKYGSESIKQLHTLWGKTAIDGIVSGQDILDCLSQHRVDSLKAWIANASITSESGTERIIRELYTTMPERTIVNLVQQTQAV